MIIIQEGLKYSFILETESQFWSEAFEKREIFKIKSFFRNENEKENRAEIHQAV